MFNFIKDVIKGNIDEYNRLQSERKAQEEAAKKAEIERLALLDSFNEEQLKEYLQQQADEVIERIYAKGIAKDDKQRWDIVDILDHRIQVKEWANQFGKEFFAKESEAKGYRNYYDNLEKNGMKIDMTGFVTCDGDLDAHFNVAKLIEYLQYKNIIKSDDSKEVSALKAQIDTLQKRCEEQSKIIDSLLTRSKER